MKKLIIFVFLTLIIAPPVLAAGLVPCGYDLNGDGIYTPATEGCKLCHFFVMIQGIINFVLFTLVPPLAVLMVVVGGGMFILGSGYDPTLINKGRSVLTSVAIGLLIIYGSWVFVNTFFVLIGLANTNLGARIGQWFVFPCP
ncbi:MAG: hypothetical protein A2117_02635 [Candidatus Wildermuthbacteria bacterium GWA2_46_15]|uniref:Uncharacterized protein n=1 Tax=Candidatus Wildermuthbacteria bacterium GWA2_46_15 TaxID=1802443 RepID=A0A1G2QR20_9BACT|nr:MAG: hypothetical protein A2117_02635 [Candidatus Wildermuthbacteria bacterium GWA2_46_15]